MTPDKLALASRAEQAGVVAEPRMTEREWRTLDEFRRHWGDFCDADPFPTSDGFTDRMEAAGLIHFRAVTKRDVEDDPFAYERGIELGGGLWEPTEAGRRALASTEDRTP